MNKTVELVNEWAKYESVHPDGEIADFCRYYLARQARRTVKGSLVGGVIPNATDGLLMKIIGRISKLNMWYANCALKGTDINQIEEFGMLATIKQNRNPRKSDVIQGNLFELSSGTDMLGRLIKKGLVKEYMDLEDKRSKRVELTAKGEKMVEVCLQKVTKNARMIFQDVGDDDKKLCIELLKGVEMKFSMLWTQHKGKTFDEIFRSLQKT